MQCHQDQNYHLKCKDKAVDNDGYCRVHCEFCRLGDMGVLFIIFTVCLAVSKAFSQSTRERSILLMGLDLKRKKL